MRNSSLLASLILAFGTVLFVAGCGAKRDGPKSAALIVSAKEAMAAGDSEGALKAVNEAIVVEPSAWAYALRAKIHAKAGSDAEARDDCEAGLKLDESNEELKWILDELERPVGERFQSAVPRSAK